MKKEVPIYAVYKGDKFLDVGTFKELKQTSGVPANTLQWLKSDIAKNRSGKKSTNKLEIIQVGIEVDGDLVIEADY